jgi:hypothetical protein
MEQSLSWEANRFANSQEIPHILWNLKVHYRIHKCRQLSLYWASSIQFIPTHPTSWRSILILPSHLSLGLPNGLFLSGFPTKSCTCLSPPPYLLHAPPISFFSILSPAQEWVRSTDQWASIMQFSPLSWYVCKKVVFWVKIGKRPKKCNRRNEARLVFRITAMFGWPRTQLSKCKL